MFIPGLNHLKIWFGGMLVVAVGVLSGMMTLVANLSG